MLEACNTDLGDKNDRSNVNVHLFRVILIDVQILQQGVDGDSAIMNENVDFASTECRGLDTVANLLSAILRSEVGLNGVCFSAELLDLGDDDVGFLYGITVVNVDVGSSSGEEDGNSCSDTPGSSCNENECMRVVRGEIGT